MIIDFGGMTPLYLHGSSRLRPNENRFLKSSKMKCTERVYIVKVFIGHEQSFHPPMIPSAEITT